MCLLLEHTLLTGVQHPCACRSRGCAADAAAVLSYPAFLAEVLCPGGCTATETHVVVASAVALRASRAGFAGPTRPGHLNSGCPTYGWQRQSGWGTSSLTAPILTAEEGYGALGGPPQQPTLRNFVKQVAPKGQPALSCCLRCQNLDVALTCSQKSACRAPTWCEPECEAVLTLQGKTTLTLW